jgi:hypothetical protein
MQFAGVGVLKPLCRSDGDDRNPSRSSGGSLNCSSVFLLRAARFYPVSSWVK